MSRESFGESCRPYAQAYISRRTGKTLPLDRIQFVPDAVGGRVLVDGVSPALWVAIFQGRMTFEVLAGADLDAILREVP